MSRLKRQIGEYYHIYNRGVDKRSIFMDENDYKRFFRMVREFSKVEPPIGGSTLEFVCYCLNPNHFHFLLKQTQDRGIEKFMQRLGTGYTMYFNQKYNRSGSLFEGRYKIRWAEDNSGFLWLSAYINGNPEIHQITKANDYQWSSYSHYLDKRKDGICKKEDVLSQFKNVNEYQDFVQIVVQEARFRKKEIRGFE